MFVCMKDVESGGSVGSKGLKQMILQHWMLLAGLLLLLVLLFYTLLLAYSVKAVNKLEELDIKLATIMKTIIP